MGYLQCIGSPFQGEELQQLRNFLSKGGLVYADDIDFTVNFVDHGQIIGTGSLAGYVLKCIFVSPDRQGEGLTEKLITVLTREAACRGERHLFLYTKPENKEIFASLGFYTVTRTEKMLLMENIMDGVYSFVNKIPRLKGEKIGAVVCNCNPFTLGHQYLIERASEACDVLYVFVVSEEKSIFPAGERKKLVEKGTTHLKNVKVCSGGPYLVSYASFPDYFFREREQIQIREIQCELDLKIFYACFARPLGIGVRYIGEEPNSAVMEYYNQSMHQYLEERGMKVREIPRRRIDGEPISASRVRQFLEGGEWEKAERMLPPVTIEYLHSEKGRKVIAKLQEGKRYGR